MKRAVSRWSKRRFPVGLGMVLKVEISVGSYSLLEGLDAAALDAAPSPLPDGFQRCVVSCETRFCEAVRDGQPVAGRSPQLLKARRGPGPGQVLLRFAHHAGGMQVRLTKASVR